MESFTDTGLILALRPYMDKGVVVSVLTRAHGRHAGFAYKSALAGIEIGATCDLRWEARTEGQLGAWRALEVERSLAPLVMGDRLRLTLLQCLCGMCDTILPEREPHTDLFAASCALADNLAAQDDPLVLGAMYVLWEIMLLQSLGYGLDLSKCAASETTVNLVYVSPKTGKAVSAEAGEPYKDKLLKLPSFLRPDRSGDITADDVRDGLTLTQTFFEKWVLTHMSTQLPAVRYAVAAAL